MTIFGGYNAGLEPGAIMPVAAGSPIPDGFLLCDGSAISRAQYPELFAAIGTNYGAGDGSTTFNIPNGVMRLLGDWVMVQGNGKALGLRGNNGAGGWCAGGSAGGTNPYYFKDTYPNAGIDPSGINGSKFSDGYSVGVTTVGQNSGLVANMASQTIALLIKYRW